MKGKWWKSEPIIKKIGPKLRPVLVEKMNYQKIAPPHLTLQLREKVSQDWSEDQHYPFGILPGHHDTRNQKHFPILTQIFIIK